MVKNLLTNNFLSFIITINQKIVFSCKISNDVQKCRLRLNFLTFIACTDFCIDLQTKIRAKQKTMSAKTMARASMKPMVYNTWQNANAMTTLQELTVE